MTRGAKPVYASDGLVARDNGVWAKEKLSFLDEYVPPAIAATSTKLQRYYLDLFAGPGVNVDGEKSPPEEFEGSSLRVLKMTAPRDERLYFTHAFMVNKSHADHDALTARVLSLYDKHLARMPYAHAKTLEGDSNRLIYSIMRKIHPEAYVLVFADIEKPNQWPWSTVKALKAMGHRSVDLYLLFPLDMAINRMISFNREATEENANALTRFYGSEDWRAIADRRITDAQSPQLRADLLELYQQRLRVDMKWPYVNVVRDVHRKGRHKLYKMLHATAHPAGDNIARWSAGQRGKGDQIDFFSS